MGKVLCAVKALINYNNRFLIVRQKIDEIFLWDLPGGKMQYCETPYETLVREVKEETNLDIEIQKCVGIWWFFRIADNDQIVCPTFLCRALSDNINLTMNPTKEKLVEFKWLTKHEFLEIDSLVDESLKKLLSESL